MSPKKALGWAYLLGSVFFSLVIPGALFVYLQLTYPPRTIWEMLGTFMLGVAGAIPVVLSSIFARDDFKDWEKDMLLWVAGVNVEIRLFFQLGLAIFGLALMLVVVQETDSWIIHLVIYLFSIVFLNLGQDVMKRKLDNALWTSTRMIRGIKTDVGRPQVVFSVLIGLGAVVPPTIWFTHVASYFGLQYKLAMLILFAFVLWMAIKLSKIGTFSDLNEMLWAIIKGRYPQAGWSFVLLLSVLGTTAVTILPVLLSGHIYNGAIFLIATSLILIFGARVVLFVAILLLAIGTVVIGLRRRDIKVV